MGFCISHSSMCNDNYSAIDVHRSIGLGNQSSSLNEQNSGNKIIPNYQINDLGYKIQISLVFFCNDNNIKNSFTYKFQLYVDNSGIEEENFTPLGYTEATICQSKIKFKKIFETIYFFSKGQRIKICCLENEKIIKTSLFYLGKMLNGFENPKLIIEKDNEKIGELLILINRENNKINKKCLFEVNILNNTKISEKSDYFFSINKISGEIIYTSKIFESTSKDIRFSFEIRKFLICEKNKYLIFNLYKIKEINKNENNINNQINDNKIKDIKNKENNSKKIMNIEYELVKSINISYEDLISNNGINIFKFNIGLLSYLLNEEILMKISYTEKEYTSFYEYISSQLHLNLALIINKEILEKYSTGIKFVVNLFHSILSLYNHDEKKYIYIKDKSIKKVNNYNDFYNDIINNEKKEIYEENDIFPYIENLYNNYIHPESNKGINKYFIVLIFTDKKFDDLNSDTIDSSSYNINKYKNFPINFKIFNFGDKNNYVEKNDININIIKNNNEDIKYNRIIFQFYNINDKIIEKRKINKFINDIPYLIEDYFEIQKYAKFTIFED